MDVASGWPAAAGVEADQFHAEFVEVSVAGRVLFIEIPPAMPDKTLAVYPTKIVSVVVHRFLREHRICRNTMT